MNHTNKSWDFGGEGKKVKDSSSPEMKFQQVFERHILNLRTFLCLHGDQWRIKLVHTELQICS